MMDADANAAGAAADAVPARAAAARPGPYLMEPEAMEEVPADLADAWLARVCPAGSRCLLVAAHGVCQPLSRTRTRTGCD
jgi:hypothetical protein